MITRKPPVVEVFCDESCTNLRYMVIGSLWIRAAHCTQVSEEIERLKQQAGERHEIKWNAT